MCFLVDGKNVSSWDFRALKDVTIPFEPATIAIFLVELAGDFFIYERDHEKRLEGYFALQKAGVINFIFDVIEHLKFAPDSAFVS